MKSGEESEFQKMVKGYDQVINQLSSLALMAKIYPKVFSEGKYHKYHVYFDRILFVILSQIDLVIGLKSLYTSMGTKEILERKYFARGVILTSWEIVNNPNKILSKNSRAYIKEKMGEESLTIIQDLVKKLNQIKKKHGAMLKELRDKTAGHKHENAIELAEMIKNIDSQKFYNIGYSVFKIQHELIGQLVKLLEKDKE